MPEVVFYGLCSRSVEQKQDLILDITGDRPNLSPSQEARPL
jgi:hypothetical protein